MIESRETIGYVCRWALMCMVALISAVAAALMAYSVMMMPTEFSTRVTTSDFARQGAPVVNMTVFHEPVTRARMLVINVGDGSARGYLDLRGLPYIVLPGEATDMGDHTVFIKGCPYGSAAFETHTPTLRVVSPDRPLYLIDARAALEAAEYGKSMAAGKTSNSWHDLIGTLTEFSRLGTVLLFHPGTPHEMARDRQRLRELNVTTPVVSERLDADETPLRSTQRLVGNLTPKAGTLVLTADEAFYKSLVDAKAIFSSPGGPGFDVLLMKLRDEDTRDDSDGRRDSVSNSK